jgi:hypothetical protein
MEKIISYWWESPRMFAGGVANDEHDGFAARGANPDKAGVLD